MTTYPEWKAAQEFWSVLGGVALGGIVVVAGVYIWQRVRKAPRQQPIV